MRVRCKHCTKFENGMCSSKGCAVASNKSRDCSCFEPDPVAFAHEADKIYLKSKIPVYAPTWRYYATNRELVEQGQEKGPMFVRINPNV